MTTEDISAFQIQIIEQFNDISKKCGFKQKSNEELLDIHKQLSKYTFFLLSMPSELQQEKHD